MCLMTHIGPSFGSVTGRIAGRVTDMETGKGLPGVEVTIENESFKTTTDSQGDYFIILVPVGMHVVSAKFTGYISVRVKKTIVSPDLTTRVDISLPKRKEGDQDTIRVENMVQEVGALMSAVFEREFKRRSLEEIIGDQPGVIESGFRLSRKLHLRGGYSNDIAYFLDGQRVYDPDLIDNDMISCVYVTKEGCAPEYGDAVSGIVNIVTKEEKFKHGGIYERCKL